LRRFEKWGLRYLVGLRKNSALLQPAALAELVLADMYRGAGIKQRMIDEFDYAVRSWDRQRRVIARLEHVAHGFNPRFVVTNLRGDPQTLYERAYCARSEAENCIQEAQLALCRWRQLP
jgi:hypothetical protein